MSDIEKKHSNELISTKQTNEEEDEDDLKNFKNLINIECNKLKSLFNEIFDIYQVIQKKRQRINELNNNIKNDNNGDNIKNNNHNNEIASGKIIETLSAKKNKFFKSYKLIIYYKKQQCCFGPYKSKKFLKIFKNNVIEELKKINIKNNNENNNNKEFNEPSQEQKNSIKKCFQELKEQIELLYPPLDEYQKIVKNHKNLEDSEENYLSIDESNNNN
jgi:hypothetical protein